MGEKLIDLRLERCTCGCGERVNNRFKAGHDQRLKGRLTRAYLTGSHLVVVSDVGRRRKVSAVEAARLLDGISRVWSERLERLS